MSNSTGKTGEEGKGERAKGKGGKGDKNIFHISFFIFHLSLEPLLAKAIAKRFILRRAAAWLFSKWQMKNGK